MKHLNRCETTSTSVLLASSEMRYPAWPAGRTCNPIILSLTWQGAKPRTLEQSFVRLSQSEIFFGIISTYVSMAFGHIIILYYWNFGKVLVKMLGGTWTLNLLFLLIIGTLTWSSST